MSFSTQQYDRYDCKPENIWKSPFSSSLEKILQKYWNDLGKSIEVEVRLGILSENSFISGVGYSYFDGMKKYLLNKNIWTNKDLVSIKPKEVISYDLMYSNQRRVSLIYENGDIRQGEVIEKRKYDRIDFVFSKYAYSMRLGTASEIPLSAADKQELYLLGNRYFHNKPDATDPQPINIRKKIRWSFNDHNNYEIDMTIIHESKVLNDIESSKPIYEIEYEFGEPKTPILPYIIKHITNIGKYLLTMKDELLLIPSDSKFNSYNTIESCLNCDITIEDIFPRINDPLLDIIRNNNGILPSIISKQLHWIEAFPNKIEKLNGEIIKLKEKDNCKMVSITCDPGEVKYNNNIIPICAGHIIGVINKDEWVKYKCNIVPSTKRKHE